MAGRSIIASGIGASAGAAIQAAVVQIIVLEYLLYVLLETFESSVLKPVLLAVGKVSRHKLE